MNLGVQYFETRHEWRTFLTEVFDSATEVWFAFPLKGSGKTGVSYNDAVEEALCFGWIDSTVRALDAEEYKIQRFTPRRRGSSYSQSNKERLKWLLEREMVHPSKVPEIEKILADPFVFPPDILTRCRPIFRLGRISSGFRSRTNGCARHISNRRGYAPKSSRNGYAI